VTLSESARWSWPSGSSLDWPPPPSRAVEAQRRCLECIAYHPDVPEDPFERFFAGRDTAPEYVGISEDGLRQMANGARRARGSDCRS
jgi:hypothetical protein